MLCGAWICHFANLKQAFICFMTGAVLIGATIGMILYFTGNIISQVLKVEDSPEQPWNRVKEESRESIASTPEEPELPFDYWEMQKKDTKYLPYSTILEEEENSNGSEWYEILLNLELNTCLMIMSKCHWQANTNSYFITKNHSRNPRRLVQCASIFMQVSYQKLQACLPYNTMTFSYEPRSPYCLIGSYWRSSQSHQPYLLTYKFLDTNSSLFLRIFQSLYLPQSQIPNTKHTQYGSNQCLRRGASKCP